jgi:hypothetical protein
MASSEPVVRLRHGTTKKRAEAILLNGPDPNYKEPGGLDTAEGFSTARIGDPCPFGSPEAVAAAKALLFPDEDGPAIIEFEVSEALARKADLGGEVRFEPGFGLEELLAAWPSLSKRILVP